MMLPRSAPQAAQSGPSAINANLYLGDSAAEIVFLDELAALGKEKGCEVVAGSRKMARGAGNHSDATQRNPFMSNSATATLAPF
jgi:hypothetical protein